jgi:nucleotide-binding universal stress UspA family protein
MNALRILVANDGSSRAQVAVDLVATVRWPARTVVEILEVNEPLMPGMEVAPETLRALEREVQDQIDTDLALAKSRLLPLGTVGTVSRRGRAASEIVHTAERAGSDLIVLGSRGRGPLATMLLGSVAAEVIDRSPCPVLIARIPRLGRIAVADDGSAAAGYAVRLVSTWPIFSALPTRVVSVAPVFAITGVGPIRHEDAKQSYAEGVDALRETYRRIAREGAKQLTEAGVPAEPDTRLGDPAEEIINGALEHAADLIVIGSRGQTGLQRLVLGSVARNVLTHAPLSVLIVRRPRRPSRPR